MEEETAQDEIGWLLESILLLFRVSYVVALIWVPLALGWVVIYKCWIHKWEFVNDILFNRENERQKQPPLRSKRRLSGFVATASPSIASARTSTTSTKEAKGSLRKRAS
ncbi:hypothetical protein QOT17_025169 [Balamuthia mandrillaris]